MRRRHAVAVRPPDKRNDRFDTHFASGVDGGGKTRCESHVVRPNLSASGGRLEPAAARGRPGPQTQCGEIYAFQAASGAFTLHRSISIAFLSAQVFPGGDVPLQHALWHVQHLEKEGGSTRGKNLGAIIRMENDKQAGGLIVSVTFKSSAK